MKVGMQVVQELGSGVTRVAGSLLPFIGPMEVLVETRASLISAGTERYVVQLAMKWLLGKARRRPDQVKRVIQKFKQEGLRSTVAQLRAKLDEPMPLGYSAAGTVLECGRAVQRLKVGNRVAVAAPHASVVAIGENLCATIPNDVTFEQAAYASVAAIALQGVRLARVSLGERVLVIGLGLIGQIAVALLKAQGCRVFATDIDPARLPLAKTMGADQVHLGSPRDAVRAFSEGYGVDAAIITAATTSNEPIEFAADVCRPKGRIVLVGVAGLQIPRQPFFEKELEFTVSHSLGAGRGDPTYEEKGIDYPIGYARWTVRRNMEAVLDMIAVGKLPVERLTTHRFPIQDAPKAYDLITGRGEPYLGIVLQYPDEDRQPVRRLELGSSARAGHGTVRVSVVGAGNFARLVLLPPLARLPRMSWRGICTARGLMAEHTGRKYGFAFATTDVEEVLRDPETDAIVIATRHHLHADFVMRALRAGKHVFVEKPLCIHPDELSAVEACVSELKDRCPILMVGFNRRFSSGLALLRAHFADVRPLSVSYRFATAELPAAMWPHDPEIGGGRIVGEACHAIDTCVALVGSPPVRVFAESLAKLGGIETTDDRVFITLRHADGSVSSISYQAGGDRSGPAERIEVFGGGRTATLSDWNRMEMWHQGRRRRASGGKDKGHGAELSAFVRACREGGPWPIPWDHIYGTTWASLMAVHSLRTGWPVSSDQPCAQLEPTAAESE